ncbi:MAG: MmcQ/YjbR family DNA-binding protein [Bacteroidetes bacterium]|nr:MmcQ/YjbR family DNA-binding protein [Bacteroidota bacterium]MBS1648388.1 MmcQ/YjbR family DNA-binding protein [Bacteroidota bacterium]
MDIEQIIQYTLSKKDVEETLPFGPNTLVFKVKGKIFLLLSLDEKPLRLNVKCNPEYAIELRERYASVIPGYHMNKKHWNTIIINGELSAKLILSFINDSYNLVNNPKKKV